MRTLLTQMRLKRLIRLHGQYAERSHAGGGRDARAREAVVRRLLAAVDDVQDAWRVEFGDAGHLAGLDRHVRRALAAIRAEIAVLERPTTDVAARSGEFRDTVIPLLFFLRGLEETRDDALLAWLDPRPLQRSA
jgi:hypothetical protein